MSAPIAEIRSVVVEREMPFPPEKIWRALTLPHLIEEWLMKADFKPLVGHHFEFRTGWGAIDCKVLEVEPLSTLSYTWDALGLESVVTFTLTPTSNGTRLRMEQRSFKPDQEQAFRGATAGWRRFLASLQQTLERME